MNKKNKILVYLKILIFQYVLSQSEVYVKVGSNYQFIANNNLLLYKEDELESFYDKLRIFSKGINNKLGDLENQLPPNFVRTHRSYITNRNYVKQVQQKFLMLMNGTQIPISRKHQRDWT